jgi:group I intron endonuclease
MKKIGIYKITSPSGKVYIGQAIDIERRWNQYRRLGCKNQSKLYASLNHYGFEAHTFEIIMECAI